MTGPGTVGATSGATLSPESGSTRMGRTVTYGTFSRLRPLPRMGLRPAVWDASERGECTEKPGVGGSTPPLTTRTKPFVLQGVSPFQGLSEVSLFLCSGPDLVRSCFDSCLVRRYQTCFKGGV
jgi:hypothetical protein